MRKTRRLVTLALCLSIGGLAISGISYDETASAAPTTAASSGCQALPAPSASASPTASATASGTASPTTAAASTPPPTDLCVTVQASQDSIQAGQTATWSVQVFAQNGPVTGVSVTITSSLGNSAAVFTARCPGGDGGSTCSVGDVGTVVTASSYQMDAQITVPSGTAAGNVVTLTAVANSTPALSASPSAATTVSVTAATASPSASATSASASASAKSATPSASGQAAATPAATVPSIGALPTLPAVAAPVTPQTQVTAVSNPGSIGSLLPVITPAAYATSPLAPTAGLNTAPAAESVANPAPTAQGTSAGNFVMVIPTADAEKIGLAVLLIMVGLVLGLRAKGRAPRRRGAHSAASSGTSSGTSPDRAEPSSGDKTDDSTTQTQG